MHGYGVMIGQDTIEILVQFAREDPRIVGVYIFGSVAQERDHAESDMDIALMVRSDVDGFERIEMETGLGNLVGQDVHLVIFHTASPLLKHQILKYGQLIYEADSGERVRQEVLARSEYFDTKGLFKELEGVSRD